MLEFIEGIGWERVVTAVFVILSAVFGVKWQNAKKVADEKVEYAKKKGIQVYKLVRHSLDAADDNRLTTEEKEKWKDLLADLLGNDENTK